MKALAVTKTALTGNYAVAHAVKLARPQVIAAYPITPQTTIVEKLSEFVAKGELKASFVNVESEFSALAVVYGAAMAGARSFTATSSHGLFYMYEMLWWAAGSRAPIVMAVVTRTLGPPWNIHDEHNDILAIRDTGWAIAMASNVQEVLDLTIQAFKLAESAYVPVAVGLDGFVLSHTVETVELPPQEIVDEFLPPRNPDLPMRLRPGEPVTMGNLPADDRLHAEHLKNIYKAHQEAKKLVKAIDAEYGKLVGREYGGAVERLWLEGAKYAVVCMGAWCGDAKEAVRSLRREGMPVGLMRIRFVRPFPDEEIAELSAMDKVVVFDRDITPAGGVLGREVASVLGRDKVVNVLAGLAGVDFKADEFKKAVKHAVEGEYGDRVVLL
ncbi:MAG: transketolase C-terminal domain-containing protein [Thermoproteus sp.]